METDKMFLSWIRDRLCIVHGEDSKYDFMRKLQSIIDELPDDQVTKSRAECRVGE